MLPTSNVGAYIQQLAREHHVAYLKTVGDVWADAVTLMSDDDVALDATEELIIALVRAGVVTSEDAVPLQVHYLREKFGHEKLSRPR